MAIGDVFDVITSARSYKEPSSTSEARAEIVRCSGTQFDPRLVRAFVDISLNKMRLVLGPFSWLTHAPLLARLPLTPSIGAALGGVAALTTAVATGIGGGGAGPGEAGGSGGAGGASGDPEGTSGEDAGGSSEEGASAASEGGLGSGGLGFVSASVGFSLVVSSTGTRVECVGRASVAVAGGGAGCVPRSSAACAACP